MIKDINALMHRVNCKKWHKDWEQYFPLALKEYEESGCIYAHREYYEMLEYKYGHLGEFTQVLQKAADAIKGDEAFELFLVFICMILRERENVRAELGDFIQPVSPEGRDDIKYDMLTALAICSQSDACYKNFISHLLPDDVIRDAMKLMMNGIKGFRIRHNGADGYDLLSWFQLTVKGELFQFHNLQAQINSYFYADAKVFKNSMGEVITLSHNQKIHSSGHILGARFFEDEKDSWIAEYVETEAAFIGYPYDEKGLVKKEKVVLSKDEWHIALQKGDPVIALHIPANASLKNEVVEEFLKYIRQFFKEYYPEYEYKAITIGSWLMDPQLTDMLDEDSSIVKFQKRFRVLTVASQGNSVFKFVFKKPDLNFEIKELPEDTSLQRKIKAMCLENKTVYEAIGYIV